MVYITKAELDAMNHNVIDDDTGMTALDLFEWEHAYEDIIIL